MPDRVHLTQLLRELEVPSGRREDAEKASVDTETSSEQDQAASETTGPAQSFKDTAEAAIGVAVTHAAEQDLGELVREAAEIDTGSRWMRSKWADWFIPTFLGAILPIAISALGAVWVYIRAVNDQVLLAVIGALVSLFTVVLSLLLAAAVREARRGANEQLVRLGRARDQMVQLKADMERQGDRYRERLKADPVIFQRLQELLREERARQNPQAPGEEQTE